MFMLDTSRLKQHELRMLSGMARHVSLQTECAKYSRELSSFLKDKDSLLIDLVKALKRITNEWRSWNHKLFGGLRPNAYVASVDQIFELLEWTEKTYPASKVDEADTKTHWQFCVETLRRYITIHAQMQRFYSKFVQNIYCPLIVYYKTKNCRKTISKLRNILNNWSVLLHTGTIIQEKCFTNESIQFFMEVIYYSGCRDFYLVLRLIPDLCMKAAECVRMVQMLLDSTESNGYERERSYIFEVWRSIDTFDVQTKEEKKLKELTEEKSLVTSDATDQNVRLSIVQESLEETRSRSEKVRAKVDELTKRRSERCKILAELGEQLSVSEKKSRDIKFKIDHNNNNNSIRHTRKEAHKAHKATGEMRKRWVSMLMSELTPLSSASLPNLRTLSNANYLEQLKLEFKATCMDIENVRKSLSSNRNVIENIEYDLKGELHEKAKLEKVESLLVEEERLIEMRSKEIEVKDRVISGYISRIEKNIKKATERLPPIKQPSISEP